MLGILNFLILQWFGVRLARTDVAIPAEGGGIYQTFRWTILRWIWPLTGWWSPYRWVYRVRPHHARRLARGTPDPWADEPTRNLRRPGAQSKVGSPTSTAVDAASTD